MVILLRAGSREITVHLHFLNRTIIAAATEAICRLCPDYYSKPGKFLVGDALVKLVIIRLRPPRFYDRLSPCNVNGHIAVWIGSAPGIVKHIFGHSTQQARKDVHSIPGAHFERIFRRRGVQNRIAEGRMRCAKMQWMTILDLVSHPSPRSVAHLVHGCEVDSPQSVHLCIISRRSGKWSYYCMRIHLARARSGRDDVRCKSGC
jgi:hypothetical protein